MSWKDFGPQSEFPRVRWAVFCLVFFGIPLLMICAYSNKLWSEREGFRRQKFLQQQASVLAARMKWVDTKDFFTTLMHRGERKIRGSRQPLQTFQQFSRHLKARFPGVIEAFAVNANGPIPGASDSTPGRALLKRFFAAYQELYQSNSQLLQSQLPMFKAFFGPVLKYNDIANHQLTEVGYGTRRSFIFFSRPMPFGMFFIFFHRPPDWEMLSIKDQLRIFNKNHPDRSIALLDSSQTNSSTSIPQRFGVHNLNRIQADFAGSSEDHIFSQRQWWFQKLINSTCRLMTTATFSESKKITQERQRLVSLVTLLFGLSAIVTWRFMLGEGELFLSIRVKLLLLFLFAVGLPLSVLGINARDYLIELRYRLEDQTHSKVERGLATFDRNFPQILGEIQNIIRRQFMAPIPAHLPVREVAVKRMLHLRQILQPAEAMLIDEQGDPVIRGLKRGEEEKSYKILKPVYASLLRNINTQEDNLEEVKSNKATKIVTAAGVDIEFIYANWVRSLTQIKEFKWGNKIGVQGFFPIINAKGHGEYLAMFSWSHFPIQRRYVLKFMPRLKRSLGDTDIFCHRQEPGKPIDWDRRYDIPERFRFAELIADFESRLVAAGQPMRGKVKKGETTYLLTGTRGDQINQYYFIAVSSDRAIRAEIEDFLWKTKMASLAIILIALTVGGLLARKFLTPVGHLAHGVAALRDRKFDARIPVMDRDELGELSTIFNEMMESMADLEVARIVQESLFPKGTVTVGGASVYGTCKPASQVGGDYYDYFPLSNNRIGIIIGDVSGHGVPAAMVMAMGKATIANLGDTVTNPAAVMMSLHNLLFKTLNRKKMMSCFFAIINVPGATIQYSNAGHNNPYLVRPAELIQLQCPGYPLGSRSKAKYENASLPLLPGDRILFYTDGLPEATHRDGEPIGYVRMEERLRSFFLETPEHSEQAIRAWQDAIALPGPQGDDITVLVFHYDGAPTNVEIPAPGNSGHPQIPS